MNTYVREKIVVDFHPMLCERLGKMVGRANEKIITHDVTDHFLIQVSVTHVLPVRILQIKKNCFTVNDIKQQENNIKLVILVNIFLDYCFNSRITK